MNETTTDPAIQLAALHKELGTLYATIFADGGHKQGELAGQTIEEIDWLTLEPTGRRIPALPAAAQQVLWQRSRLLTEADARAEAAERENQQLRQQLAAREAALEEAAQSNDTRGKLLYIALSALAGMWNQYCPPPTEKCPYPGHMFMSAGEEAEDVLAAWRMLRPNQTAIDPDFEHDELPEPVKQLRND